MNERMLIPISAFEQALAEAKTIPQVKNLADQADLFKQWLKKQKVGRGAQNAGAEMCLRAIRKLGDMLNEVERSKGGRPSENSGHRVLSLTPYQQAMKDANIDPRQSTRWQKLAGISDKILEEFIRIYNEMLEEITTIDFIRYNASLNKPEAPGEWLPLPIGKYRTIVIDPPWPMQKILREVSPEQYQMDYGIKTIEDIALLDIPSLISDDGAHIYLWTTERFLPDAFNILVGWGIKYIFTMVWHKKGGFQPFNLPQYNCEFILFGRFGGLEFMNTTDFPCCFEGERREHSRKPDTFYNIVERVSPPPRLDMLTREKREGFDQYGYESDKFKD